MSHMVWDDKPYKEGLVSLSPEVLERNKARRAKFLKKLGSDLGSIQTNARLVTGKTQRERKLK